MAFEGGRAHTVRSLSSPLTSNTHTELLMRKRFVSCNYALGGALFVPGAATSPARDITAKQLTFHARGTGPPLCTGHQGADSTCTWREGPGP